MYPAIVTSDWHLTDNPSEEYRWSIFDRVEALRKKYNAKSLLVLGDVTNAKDRHPARLVNRVATNFARLRFDETVVLRGNHDYLQKEHTFFGFLSELENVQFVVEPLRRDDWVFVPHSRDVPLPGLGLVDGTVTHCFLHQTFSGAVASNGQTMEGEGTTALPHPQTCAYWSGDIHVPQCVRVGDAVVEYVGSPHPVHFGDRYKPRVVLLADEFHHQSIAQEGHPARASVKIAGPEDVAGLGLGHDDQVKIEVALHASDMPRWAEIQREVQHECDKRGIRLHALTLKAPARRRQLIGPDGGGVRPSADARSVLDRYADDRGLHRAFVETGKEFL